MVSTTVWALRYFDSIIGSDQCCGVKGRKTTAPRGVETVSEELGNPPRPILRVMELLELRVQFIHGLVLETDVGEMGDDVCTR